MRCDHENRPRRHAFVMASSFTSGHSGPSAQDTAAATVHAAVASQRKRWRERVASAHQVALVSCRRRQISTRFAAVFLSPVFAVPVGSMSSNSVSSAAYG